MSISTLSTLPSVGSPITVDYAATGQVVQTASGVVTDNRYPHMYLTVDTGLDVLRIPLEAVRRVNGATWSPDTVPAPTFDLNRIRWVTAKVTTQNSEYLVVARPAFGVRVLLTKTTGERDSMAPQVGETYEGELLLHGGATLHLIGSDGQPVLRTSRVLDIHVYEN